MKMKLLANNRLNEYFKEIGILQSIQSLLRWDNDVMMPKGGATLRSEQLMYLSTKTYRCLNDPKLAELIFETESESLNEWEQANVALIKHQYLQNKAVDEALVKATTKASLACELNWRDAKINNDFKLFASPFKELLKLTKETAIRTGELFNLSPYDALLDSYDRGRSSIQIDSIFTNLESFLPNFIAEVKEKQKSQNIIPLSGDFSPEKQKELGLICMHALGFDLNRGRLDISAHPFSTGLSNDDVRITTRYDSKNFLSGLYGILHETGHALYEQNLPKSHPYQPVSRACGMTIHESQSLFVENQIGQTREFFEFIAPHITKLFGNHPSLNAENLYNIVSKITPSLIRVDADEVTYPAHVIIRYKLEKALLSGDLSVDELPLAWDAEMYKYLEIKPKNHSEGCLQDIHWACGAIGYFPTYTLGAMFAAQINHTLLESINKNELISAGNFKPIISWLEANVHSKGSKYSSNELITKASGSELDSNIFKQYLINKYL
jgi:carboxypeptidase Taq